jgi:hypothetical protein
MDGLYNMQLYGNIWLYISLEVLMKRSLIIIAAVIFIVCLSGCRTPEGNKAINEAADRQIIISNAGQFVTAVNANNALYPNDILPDDVTFEKAKETLKRNDLWPACFNNEPDETALKAWDFVEIKNGEAKVSEEG